MSKSGTIRAQFLEDDGGLLRFAVSVAVSGQDVKPEPLVVHPSKSIPRLALIERKGDGWVTKTPPDPVEGKRKNLVVDLDDPPVKGANFVRWTVFIEATAGHGRLFLQHPQCATVEARFSNKPNTAKPQKIVLKVGQFPRLVVGLNQAPVPKHAAQLDPLLGTADQLRPVVEYVVHRLQGKSSGGHPLDAAWTVQGAQPLPAKLPAKSKLAHAEEAWARQVSEMLTLTPYAGTGLAYFGTFKHDSVFLADNLDGRPGVPKVYGLVHACQHLAAFGVSSRGRPDHRFGDYNEKSGLEGRRLVSAGAGTARIVDDMGGTWIIGGNPPTPIKAKQAKNGVVDPNDLICAPSLQHAETMYEIDGINGCDFAPGALFLMSNRPVKNDMNSGGNGSQIEGKYEVIYKGFTPVARWRIGTGGRLADNTDGAHIGFVLRTDPSVLAGVTPKKDGKFQLLDTGGFGVVGRGDGVTVLNVGHGFHSGNFDGPAGTMITSKHADINRGIGVWPRMTVSDAQPLFDHVHEVLAKLRPLGLARMFILDGTKTKVRAKDVMEIGTPKGRWLLYASPLVPMYEADDLANYSISRYVWSLRGVPAADQIQVRWSIYLPQRTLAQALLDAGRDPDISAVAKEAFANLTNPLHKRKLSKKDGSPHVAKILAKYTLPILDFHSTPSGRAVCSYKFPKMNRMSFLNYASREAWDGKIRLPMDQTFMNGSESASGFPEYVR